MTIRTVRRLLMAGLLAASATTAMAQQAPNTLHAQDVAATSDRTPAFLGNDAIQEIFLSPTVGAIPTHVINGADGAFLGAGFPFGPFGGGARIGAGDLTGDGVSDILAGMGPGGGLIALLDGATLASLGAGYPFGPAFGGGVSLAIGDVDGDGRNDIVAGQASFGGTVTVFNGVNYSTIFSLSPFGPGYGGGVHVATGDVDGDGRAEVIVGQASGGVVAIVSGATGAVTASGAPFGGVNGVFVAAGDVTNDGRAEVIVAPGSGNGPVIVANMVNLSVVASLTPFPASFSGGVRVAAADLSGDGRVEILAVPGPGITPVLKIYDGATFANTASYPFSTDFQSVGAMIALPAARGIRFTSAAAATFGSGAAASFTVRTTGAPPVTGITSTGALPAGITFTDNGNGTATLAGTAPSGTVGTFPITFTASNGRSTPVQQSFVLTIKVVPAITSAATTTFALGLNNTFTITATGSPLPTLSHTGALPTGVSFANNGNGTATLSGTPAAGTVGAYPLTLTATSDTESATQSFVLTVRDGPVFTSPSTTSFVVGVASSFMLTTLASPAVTTISRVGGTVPNGLTLTDNGNGTATLAGTPAAGSAGTYSLDVSAFNGVSAATQTLAITIRQRPVFTSAATTSFTAGAPGTFTVTTTGSPTPALSFSGALPSGVTFTSNANGTATIAGTTAGPAGSYLFVITATNGPGSSVTQNFTLVVGGPAAFTSAATATFVAGTLGNFAITTSGGPAPTITFTGALPTGVTLVNNGNGTATLAGTPGAATGGTYPLTLTATNGVGAPATQPFVLTVNRAPTITSVNATAFTRNLASSFTVTSSAFPTATVSITGAIPAGITVTPNGNGTATLAGSTNDPVGPYALVVQATNGVGATATQNLTLTLTNCTIVTLLPAAGALPGGTYLTGYNQAITATGGTGHTFAVTSGLLPPGMTLASGGTLSGPPSTTGTFNFTVTATASNTCTGSAAYSLVVSPNAQNETFNNGVGNTQYSVSGGTPLTPAVVVTGSVRANDAGPGTLLVGPASIASTNGGQVTMATAGTFLYTPAAGFIGPFDTFTYTLTDGNGNTDTAVVTINMSGVIWYVNASAGAGNGQSQSPFNTMTAAASAAQVGQIIYVHAGSPPGATALKASQRLQGAGELFVAGGLTIPAAATPTLQGTVTLANDVTVRALTVNAGGGTGVVGSGLSGTETMAGVSITSSATALTLTNLGGSFTTSGGAITATGGGGAVAISGGTGTMTLGSTVSSASGRSVSVLSHTAGSVTFGGAVTDTGTGVQLNGNGTSVIAFTGGLSLNTGGNPAFTATAGGIVTATQNNTSIVNILSSSDSALNVSNTQIGVAGLTFRSIASGAGTSTGIILDNTGTGLSNGGLTVTGNGTPNSGGLITNKTGADGSLAQGVGIYLNSTKSPSFNRMALQSVANSAIVGRNVANGFLLADSTIDAAGTTPGVNEGPIVFGLPGPAGMNGVQGTATIRDTTIAGGIENNVSVYGQSGSTALVIERTTTDPAGCKVEANNGTTGAQGILVRLEGTAVGAVTVNQCVLRGNRDAAVHATALGNSNLTVTVNASDVGRSGQGERGIVLTNGDDAVLTATITNDNFFDLPGNSVRLGQVPGSASAQSILRTTIANNVFGSAAPTTANTIAAILGSSPGAAARTRLLVQSNFATHSGLQPSVLIDAPDAGSAPAIDITFSYNHFDMAEVGAGVNGPLGLVVRSTQAAGANVCASISPNTFHWIPIASGTGGGISAQQGGGSTFRLERGSQALATPAATVLSANNGPHDFGPPPGPFSLPGSTTAVSGSLLVVENGTCVLPSAP